MTIVQLEGLGKLKKFNDLIGNQTTFQLVAQCLNQITLLAALLAASI
jgi:hypothetical protein